MPTTRLCATVTATTTAELRARRDAQAGADLVELRLDTVAKPDVAAALADRSVPVIVTCRPRWEGGGFDGSEDERRQLLDDACRHGAEYVDIEHRASFAAELIARRAGRGIVLSYHAFDAVPGDIEDRYHAMRATGAEVVKIAAAARCLGDTLRVGALGVGDEPRVVIAMGTPGVATRVLAHRFGSCWSYAGAEVAPGQIDLTRMREQFAFRDITDRTAVYGVLGAPVGHSVSPAMHNAAFRAAGIDAVYLPIEACDVDDFVEFARVVGLRGASVTAPFKQAIVPLMTRLDETARAVHAVNTIRREGAVWAGRNTDVEGFLAPLADRITLTGVRAAVLGAGGAARGVAWGLVRGGASVQVCARRVEQAVDVGTAVGATGGSMPPKAGSWDLLVNTTPTGTFPRVDESPLPWGPFGGRLVYDLVYNPAPTRLLRQAAAAGCATIGGLEMLVAQAVRQFAWWTGTTPAASVLTGAATTDLARQAEMVAAREQ